MRANLLNFLTICFTITLFGLSASLTFGQTNLARNKSTTAKQSSAHVWKHESGDKVGGPSTKALDGKLTGGLFNQEIVETKHSENDDWFEVDLGGYYKIDKIVVHPRTDCCQNMFHSTYIIVTDYPLEAKPMLDDGRINYSSTFNKFFKAAFYKKTEVKTNGSIGRYIRLQRKGSGAIELAELEVFGNSTAVAGHKPKPGKSWNATLQIPFDPNYPDFRKATGEFFSTLQRSPKIVGVKNSVTSFDIAFQDHFGDSKLIKVNRYDKDGTGFKKDTTKSMELTGLGVFGGFAKDSDGNRYVFTGTPWSSRGETGASKVYKNSNVLWEGKFYEPGNTLNTEIKSFLHEGTSRLAVSNNSLFIAFNIAPAHPYGVILDTSDSKKNTSRNAFESQYHHSYGQRLLFDGTDFVVMEKRDHDVSVTLSKFSPSETFPLAPKPEHHANVHANRVFSVYSHTNFGNNTFIELGDVEKGVNDTEGYLVLFASERDWNDKTNGYKFDKPWAPLILSPRDIGLVHVKKDFNKAKDVNWLNKKGTGISQCPVKVDNSSLVNSKGTTKTTIYQEKSDGWDWNSYGCNADKTICPCKDEINAGQTERTLVTNGVKWLTSFGESYTAKAKSGVEFTSVNHPKLVRISKNKYIAVWEEWKAELGKLKKTYVTTKAALITLSSKDGKVTITATSTPKDLGKARLMPGDDAFEFNGKAAWAIGDISKGKIVFYTLDSSLKIASYELDI